MSFLIFAVAGFMAGVFGGMGMGGGTVLIPALTVLCGVAQRTAQAANVIAFLPMAVFVLPEHKRGGLLKTDGVLWIALPAVISALLFSLVMTFLPAQVLRRAFGFFLIALALRRLVSYKK